MAEPSEPKNPAEEMVKFWQAWMSSGMDAMQRTATLFAPGGGLPEWTAGLREQIEKAIGSAPEAAKLPVADDVHLQANDEGPGLRRAAPLSPGLAGIASRSSH